MRPCLVHSVNVPQYDTTCMQWALSQKSCRRLLVSGLFSIPCLCLVAALLVRPQVAMITHNREGWRDIATWAHTQQACGAGVTLYSKA